MIRYFTSWYEEKNEERRQELITCIQKCCDSPDIDKVYLICEALYPHQHEKLTTIDTFTRYTYEDFFLLANTVSESSDLIIISNTDIFPAEGVRQFLEQMPESQAWMLSRWDVDANLANPVHHSRSDSADCWCFRAPIRPMRGNFGLGLAGCLSGDTIISYNRGKRPGGRKIKLKDFYRKFNGITKHFKDLSIPTHTLSLNTEGGVVFYNQVLSVTESGVKKTLKITFLGGETLVLTPDHRVALPDRTFVRADFLKEGDEVLSKGDMKAVSSGGKRKKAKRAVVYIKYHPHAENKVVTGHKYKRVGRARLVYEAYLNNIPYEEFIFILKTCPIISAGLKFTDPKLEIHHKDEDSLNDTLENLQLLNKEEHARLHAKTENFRTHYLARRKINKIESNGDIMTYDVTMKAPASNFCAPNVIVHNCDNAIAYCMQEAGYDVRNPSREVRFYHLHNSGIRHYNPNNPVPSPYLLVTPHLVHQQPLGQVLSIPINVNNPITPQMRGE